MDWDTIQEHMASIKKRDAQKKAPTAMDLAARRIIEIPVPKPASNRAPVDFSPRANNNRRYKRKTT